MNWRLIFSLSLLGLFMAFGTVYFIPSKIEPICWLIIFILCAYSIANNAEDRFFLHGLLVSICNSIWITAVHIMLSVPYIAHHAEESKQYVKMSGGTGMTLTEAMLIMGPITGIISGLILGLFSFIAAKILNRS